MILTISQSYPIILGQVDRFGRSVHCVVSNMLHI
jgi:hypothetical protein